MTDRLYYTDPSLRAFDARVVDVSRADDIPPDAPASARESVQAGRLLITLDRTAFYPTSGGQPFDTGTLGALRIVDVFDREDGSIVHAAEMPADAPAPGDMVHGVIDWARRFEHMQQHTGQHVLSAAFQRVASAETVSFHLGTESATIDLSQEVPAATIAAVEGEANRVVWEDRRVNISYVTAEEAARLPLRKEPVRGGRLRLIEVEDYDLSACGGTHVTRTGAVGLIAATSWERFKGGQRIEFVCGIRALRRFQAMRGTAAAAGRLLSVGLHELPAAIERLQADAKAQKRAIGGLQTELRGYRAAELTASAMDMPAGKLVLRAVDADAQGLKALALAIAGTPGHAAVLVSAARPALAVVARCEGLAVRSDQVLASLIARFGGRGGGRSELAQGGGLDASSEQILDAARRLLSDSGANA
jgi:alanyl-tRNA synthetase